FAVPTLSLSKSAAEDFLSSGQLTDGPWVDIRLALAEMLWEADIAEKSSLELRQLRPGIAEQMHAHVSGLDVVRGNPIMGDYPQSRFASDTNELVSAREFESLIATYAIRMEINRRTVQALQETHSAVMGLIEDRN
ncbi:MAG: hypothetical protein MI865_04550, partial [Proteobacteria bacterium]|nr:hypothetical protein [Pseudomonadota bacterium]